MHVPIVKTCCCGCSLKTGSYIIGSLEVVSGIILFVGGIVAIAMGAYTDDGYQLASAYAIVIVYGIIGASIGLLLIIGVKRKLTFCLEVWIVISSFSVIGYFLLTIVQGILILVLDDTGLTFDELIYILITIVIKIYYIVIVYNFKMETLSEKLESCYKLKMNSSRR